QEDRDPPSWQARGGGRSDVDPIHPSEAARDDSRGGARGVRELRAARYPGLRCGGGSQVRPAMSAFVLDASVAISSLRGSDANHARAASHLAPLLQGMDSVVVPSVFDVEVVSPLAGGGGAAAAPRRAADLFAARARVVTLGPR